MTPDRLHALLNTRGAGQPDGQFLQGLLGSDPAGFTGEAGDAMRVYVRIDFDNRRQVLAEAVILLRQGAGEPFRVLSWRDDFDGPT